jgi:hypothetical protein
VEAKRAESRVDNKRYVHYIAPLKGRLTCQRTQHHTRIKGEEKHHGLEICCSLCIG